MVIDEEKIKELVENNGYIPRLANMIAKTVNEDVNVFQLGYNKALDDFVKFASTMPTVEEEDGTIRPMWLEEMAEQLKTGGNDDKSI